MACPDCLLNCCRRLIGVYVTLLSSLLFAASNFLVYYICHVGAFEIFFFRSALLIILLMPVLYVKGHPVYVPKTWLIWLSGLSLAVMPLSFVATQNMNYGDLNAIFFSNIVLVVLLGWIFLRERVTWKTILIIILMLVGVFMVVQPETVFGKIVTVNRLGVTYCDKQGIQTDLDDTLYILTVGDKIYVFPKNYDNNRLKRKCYRTSHTQKFLEDFDDIHIIKAEIVNEDWKCEMTVADDPKSHVTGVLIKMSWLSACACMFGVGVAQAITWTLIRAFYEMDCVYVSFHQHLSACIVTVIVTSALGHWRFPPLVYEWLLIAGLSLGSAVAYVSLIYALAWEKASTVAVVTNIEVVFSYILQVAFQGVNPNWISLVGASLIIFCGVIFGYLRSRGEESGYKDIDETGAPDEKTHDK